MPELQALLQEKITFIKERCHLSRNCNVSCRKCIDVCPASSIELKEGEISFQEFNCENCGACRAVCPSEAFSANNLSFLNEVCNLDERQLTIGCTLNEKNRQDFNVGCYAFLTEGELLYLLSKKDNLTFNIANCTTCRYSRGYNIFTRSINLVQDLLMRNDKLLLCSHNKRDEGVSRRLFFKWFKQKAATALVAALPFNQKEDISTLPWRRETLLTGLKNISCNLSEKMFIRKIAARSSCTGCGGCVTICPSNALSLNDYRLSWQAKSCLNCNLCIKSCPEKALYYEEFVLQEEFWGVKILKEFLGKRCFSCGTYFEGETEQCENCQNKSITLEKNFDLCIEGIF